MHNFLETLTPTLSFEMVYIQGDAFQMGSEDEEAYEDEQPVHEVKLPDFCLGKYPVTQALWQAIMGSNPAYFKGAQRPVETVSWEDCQLFLKKLNQQTQKSYRLPSEAEWEFAARGGRLSEGYLYAGSDFLPEVGWFHENSNKQTHPVGLKLPNELGLYDMSGNVHEWCEDDWHDNYEQAPRDGSAWIDSPERGPRRVQRGGFWGYVAHYCRVSLRYRITPGFRDRFMGLRLACSPV